MIYSISSSNRGSKFVDIEFIIENNSEKELYVQLPAWRPGRYELGDFAKNIQQFQVFSGRGKELTFEKVTKDRWKIKAGSEEKVVVKYNYYANELNAGSTWVDEDQLYVNPVNCCLYVVGREEEECQLFLEKVKGEKVAIGLPTKGGGYVANSFDELADSPFIVSKKIKCDSYKVDGVEFFLWFQGECKPDFKKLKKDFKAFTKAQLNLFGSFPFPEYHFMFQILPYKAYHGVEHKTSTVISYGPGYCIMFGDDYEELLGVSSHELFHAWNIKSIRPADMWPYDFSKENYSRMGYLAEGVTTYYGDLMLWRSGVFSEDQFLKQINKTLDRHFFNYGVENMSVADSSFDTWLDGYVRGIPNRKSSIYTEGCLLSMITDLQIRKLTKGKKGFDVVLKKFFNNYYKKGKGVTENDFKAEVLKVLGEKFEKIWNHYYSPGNYEGLLIESLEGTGFELVKDKNPNWLASNVGLYTEPGSNKVLFIAPDSPAQKAGINIGDEILGINQIKIEKGTANKWAEYFNSKLELLFVKDSKLVKIDLTLSKKNYFERRRIQRVKGKPIKTIWH